jgi:hypothetical protein
MFNGSSAAYYHPALESLYMPVTDVLFNIVHLSKKFQVFLYV